MNRTETFNVWQFVDYEIADPRIRDKFLMNSTVAVLVVSLSYVILIELILKPIVRSRRVLNLKFTTTAINVFVTAGSFYFCYEIEKLWAFNYSWNWQPIDRSHSAEALHVA